MLGLSFKGREYSIKERLYNQFVVNTSIPDDTLTSRLTLIQHAIDSIQVFWEYDIKTGRNPVTRLRNYLLARKLRNDSEEMLTAMKSFLEKKENIYGYDIEIVSTPKSYLVATSRHFDFYPSTKDIYEMIENLSDYAKAEKTPVTGYPMLNVTRRDSGSFETMVALPVERQLPGKGDIIMRRIVTVKALGIKVEGGPQQIQKALQELEQYVLDHRLFSPAIPYENLYTNRMLQPDTSKWITYIYHPLL
jgi:hypothetical protein